MPTVDGSKRCLRHSSRRKRNINPLRRLRNRLERRLFKLDHHRLAVELLHSTPILGRNRRAVLWVADAYGENWNPALLRRLGILQRLAAKVAAVGNQDDRVVVVCRGIERAKRGANRAAEVRLAARRGLGAHALKGVPKIPVVGRERTNYDTGAAKRDERAAITGKRVNEVGDGVLGAFKTIWTNVLGKHRARHVDRYDDIARARHCLLHRLSPLRPRSGEEREEKPTNDACRLQSGDGRSRNLQRQFRQRLLAARLEKRPPEPRDWDKEQKHEEYRICESHLSFFPSPCQGMNSGTLSTPAAMRWRTAS